MRFRTREGRGVGDDGGDARAALGIRDYRRVAVRMAARDSRHGGEAVVDYLSDAAEARRMLHRRGELPVMGDRIAVSIRHDAGSVEAALNQPVE